MKFKKMLCGLAAFVTMLSACVMPVSAIGVETSQNPNYPSFLEEWDTVINGGYSDRYLAYKDETSGTYYECYNKYDYVFVTADETTDMHNLYDLLADEVDESVAFCLDLSENQYAFNYIEDFDYESLYVIDGVENVELASAVYTESFYNEYVFDEDTESRFIEIYVKTESDTTLTKEMFGDTGYNVVKIEESSDYLKELGYDWVVYYESTGEIASPIDFTDKAEQIEGIISADMVVEFLCSTNVSYSSTEVADTIGDINSNGVVNVSDLVLMKKYMLEYIESDGLNISKSDIDKDGSLSVSDFAAVKKRMIK